MSTQPEVTTANHLESGQTLQASTSGAEVFVGLLGVLGNPGAPDAARKLDEALSKTTGRDPETERQIEQWIADTAFNKKREEQGLEPYTD